MSLHEEHRKRLDRKVNTFGLDMLEIHEQLEHILFAVIPRGDTNELAHRLLERFRSVAGVINADPEELMAIDGVGKRTAMFLTSLPALLGIVQRGMTVGAPTQFENHKQIKDFVKSYFYGKLIEEAYLFSLNSSYRLLAVSKISSGISGETYIYPEKVARQALLDKASVGVVVHNHPCGKINPSVPDIKLSRDLLNAFNSVGIELEDSIIVCNEEVFSMREMGYLEKIPKKYE